MNIKKTPIIDVKVLNPLHVPDNEIDEEDDDEYIRYCPKCREKYQWVELIKTRHGWWTCPVCDFRGYGGFK